MYAVIQIRGTVKARQSIIDSLKLLRLHRKMHCVLIPDTPVYKGMLQKVKDYITWGEISNEVLKALVQKRARKPGNKRLSEKQAQEVYAGLLEGKKPTELGIKPVFRLSPPSKGFKHSIKQHWPRGELGYRGEAINELLKRMI